MRKISNNVIEPNQFSLVALRGALFVIRVALFAITFDYRIKDVHHIKKITKSSSSS